MLRRAQPDRFADLPGGITRFAVVLRRQTRVVDKACAAANLAPAMNLAAFNLGNASGAALGGLLIHPGLGLPLVALAGAATCAPGLMRVLLFNRYRKARLVTA